MHDIMGQQREQETCIGVIGAGAWGTALAIAMTRAGHGVMLWAREPELVQAMRQQRENARYLPGVPLPDAITPTGKLADLAACGIWLLVTPAQATRAMLRALREKGLADAPRPIVLCAKGIEQQTGAFLTGIVAEETPALAPYVLSGPSFAGEVARGLPAAVTLAARDIAQARALARQLAHERFRIYSSDDMIGVQLGGALKNVLAIACGVVEGLGLGDSARAALLTRAFAEMRRFGRALGAQPETLTGLSGLGDLMLTATSTQSRNYTLGVELGRGRRVAEVLAERITVAEGVFTAQVVARMARERGIEMPITQSVRRLVEDESDAATELKRLLARPLRDEQEHEQGQEPEQEPRPQQQPGGPTA